MKLVVGIGNPGKEYDKTRHNAGFMVLDRLNQLLGDGAFEKKRIGPEALIVRHAKLDICLAKPQTYVNNTGESVAALCRQWDCLPRDVLAICDDVNLDFGKLRLRSSSGSGGHHGLESIEQFLQTDEFSRLRVGVRNEHMPQELSGFVLEPFNKQEAAVLGALIDRAALVAKVWAEQGFEAASQTLGLTQNQNNFNKEK